MSSSGYISSNGEKSEERPDKASWLGMSLFVFVSTGQGTNQSCRYFVAMHLCLYLILLRVAFRLSSLIQGFCFQRITFSRGGRDFEIASFLDFSSLWIPLFGISSPHILTFLDSTTCKKDEDNMMLSLRASTSRLVSTIPSNPFRQLATAAPTPTAPTPAPAKASSGRKHHFYPRGRCILQYLRGTRSSRCVKPQIRSKSWSTRMGQNTSSITRTNRS